MDIIDIKILDLLERNSRISFREISKMIGKTEATVRRRVKKLEENDIINKYTILYDFNNKLKNLATVNIELDYRKIKEIIPDLKNIQEITAIWRLSGGCGILLKIEFSSMKEYNSIIEEKISLIRGVKILETCFITKIIKSKK